LDGRLDAAVSREQEGFQLRLPDLEPLQQLDAVQARQAQIEQGNIEIRLGRLAQGGLGVGYRCDRNPGAGSGEPVSAAAGRRRPRAAAATEAREEPSWY